MSDLMGMLMAGGAAGGFPTDGFPTDGLLAYWKFDEGAGTSAADASGNGHAGTLTDTGLWTPSGKINSAVEADGSNYIDLGNGSNLLSIPASGFAQAAWVYLSNATDSVRILSQGFQSSSSGAGCRGLIFRVDAGEVIVRLKQADAAAGWGGGSRGLWNTGLFLQTGWNLVIANRSTSLAEAFVYNTTEQISGSVSDSFGDLTQWASRKNLIHAESNGTTESVTGISDSGTRVDALGVWDGPLTSSERESLWNDGNGLQP